MQDAFELYLCIKNKGVVHIYKTLLAIPFTTGQLVFAACFAVAFIIGMLWAYGRDKKTTGKHYTRVYKILLGIIIIWLVLFFIIRYHSRII